MNKAQTYLFLKAPPLKEKAGSLCARRLLHNFWWWYKFLNLIPTGKTSSALNKESKIFLRIFFILLVKHFIITPPIPVASPYTSPVAPPVHCSETMPPRLRNAAIYITDYSVISHVFAWISSNILARRNGLLEVCSSGRANEGWARWSETLRGGGMARDGAADKVQVKVQGPLSSRPFIMRCSRLTLKRLKQKEKGDTNRRRNPITSN